MEMGVEYIRDITAANPTILEQRLGNYGLELDPESKRNSSRHCPSLSRSQISIYRKYIS
jgi:hypothetical protein